MGSWHHHRGTHPVIGVAVVPAAVVLVVLVVAALVLKKGVGTRENQTIKTYVVVAPDEGKHCE